MIKNLDKHISDWTEENTPVGNQLGYPECCIKEFCLQPPVLLKHSKPSKDDNRRYRAGCIDGKFTGFIPCSQHAREIVQGKIKLGDLIDYSKRDKSLPQFPNAYT